MKKKLLGLIICMAVLAVLIVPTRAVITKTASASEQRSSAAVTNIHFIKPSALEIIGNYLFVADNVADNQSVALCFDISSDRPSLCFSKTFDKKINNLSGGNGKLFVIFDDGVTAFTVSENGVTEYKTFEIAGVVDFAYGTSPYNGLPETYYALTKTDLLYYNKNGSFTNLYENSLKQTSAIVYIGNIYYLNNSIINGYDCSDSSKFTVNTANANLGSFIGITSYNNELVLFGNQNVYITTNLPSVSNSTPAAVVTAVESQESIIDVAAVSDKLFVLNKQYKIDVYSKNGEEFVKESYQIGSDTVVIEGELPTKFSGYTLIKSKGYPTNIIYKTENEQNSIEEIRIDCYDEVIALDFEGSANLPYYYVLTGDRYGWIKKSDNAASAKDDPNLIIINNKVSDDVIYKAKFTSPKGVYIYELPLIGSKTTQITQSATNRTDVTVLQKFDENRNGEVKTWYYVSFDSNGKTLTGFVETGAVGQFHGVAATDDIDILGDKKINASLFAAVTMHMTENLNDSETVCDESGNPLKLYSGQIVKIVREKEGKSFIQVLHDDNTAEFGWVSNENIVDLNAMTTNAVVGLIVLALAIVLTVLFVMLFIKGKKSKKIPADE